MVPTFGGDTVRRFGANVSAMKKLAARDFEELLIVGLCNPLLTHIWLTHAAAAASPVLNSSF